MTDTRTRRLSHVALHVLAALTSPICTCIYSTTCSCASLHGQHQHVLYEFICMDTTQYKCSNALTWESNKCLSYYLLAALNFSAQEATMSTLNLRVMAFSADPVKHPE
ncbi:hypothetical protein PR003_g3906 [Phytophthora rubi]|uniref:Secreted protein n=1 Tax=Phytophthora rubi TaxID=129364 RepID=A0A6A3NGE0_9STRA|nr:hypothetical protein PR002_g3927 [Phytophthora rubi]KAE9048843.1 hypothetical protein PR001_g3659 [Phytophthora rubi]KAE9353350.1 hypothetical protein PR003_g3906 [Phytophthora rubi]